jgi:signal transduction histidine kinase
MKLAIADDGVGMAGAPHRQGMGLPVMYQRARMIGAALTIAPRRKGGTLVTCTLAGRPEAVEVPQKAARQASRRPPSNREGNMNQSDRANKTHHRSR